MFHDHLKRIRKTAKKTQAELANYLNVSAQSISKWEKGEALPSIEFLPQMARFFNCSVNTFFSDFELELYEQFEATDDKQLLDLLLATLQSEQNKIRSGEIEPDAVEDNYPLESLFLPALYAHLKENDYITLRSLQETLDIGYGIASRIIDALIKMGITEKQDDGVCQIKKYNIDLLLPYIK